MRPAQQGDLDGFCGPYAVVNAVSALLGKRSNSSIRRELFNELGQALGAVRLLDALNVGLDAEELEGAARVAFRWLSTYLDIHLAVLRPFARGEFDTPEEFWVEVGERLAVGQSAVLSIHLPGREHWSVARGIKGGNLLLHDSGGIKSLALWRFKLGKGEWRIIPDETLVIVSTAGAPS